MKNFEIVCCVLLSLLMASCATVMPDQVGVKRTFGRINDKVRQPGIVGFNPFTTRVVRVPIRTMNLAIVENLPSKEGLTIRSESSILYRIQPSAVPQILKETGMEFEEMLILPVFRSAASDVCSKYDAKDMHSARRAEIEEEIKKRLVEVCATIIDAEAKAQGTEIEAEGIKRANELITLSLTPNVLKFKQIEAFQKLASSPNTKTIITDGKTPMVNILGNEGN